MKRRILIVDDDPLIRTLITVSLADLGEVVDAIGGYNALALLKNSKFDLVLLDWDMPKMSGLKVLKTIRRRGHEVPVIMVTGEADREHVVTAMQSGASDYVVKPFDMDIVREKVGKFLTPA